MSKCCPSTTVQFINKSQSTIPYTEQMRDLYGRVPRVQIAYFDPEANDYYISNNQTLVKLTGNPVSNIVIDHGGVSTGMVKIH